VSLADTFASAQPAIASLDQLYQHKTDTVADSIKNDWANMKLKRKNDSLKLVGIHLSIMNCQRSGERNEIP